MNDKNKKRGSRFIKFVEGRGFYIVLFLCVAVIGVSAWTLNLTMRETGLDLMGSLNNELVEAITIPTPAVTPAPTPAISTPQNTEPKGGYLEPSPPAVVKSTPAPTAPAQQQETTPTPKPEAPVIVQEKVPAAYIWPVSGSISRAYAVESLLYDRTMQDWRTHRGIDIEADLGATVKCVADGTVESIISEPMYGTSVTVRHSGGLTTVYRNLSAEPAVTQGQVMKMGDVIGSVGQTASFEIGDVTHLHFEAAMYGKSIDPREFLPDF